MPADPSSDAATTIIEQVVAMNEALLLGSLRQHGLTETSEILNGQLRYEIAKRREMARELAEKARLLDLTHDAIIVRDVNGVISYWNRGAEEIYGWSSEEVLGLASEDLFKTEYPEELERLIAKLHETGRWVGELIHTRRDGRRITVLVRKTLDRDSEGNPASVLQNITDITEWKQATEALAEAGARIQFMAESMPQKIFTAKPSGEIDYLNRQWSEYTGLPFEAMQDSGWVQFIHPDDLEETVNRWNHSIRTGERLDLEVRFRRADGQFRWHLSRADAMRNSEGEITIWIGSITDIDDMILAQEELLEAEAQLADRALHLEGLVAERTDEVRSAHAELLAESDERKRLEVEYAGAIEGERRRLGMELHDGIVQELTGISLLLHVLAQNLEGEAHPEAETALRLARLIEITHGDARDLSKSFYPVELEHLGLAAALEGNARRIQQKYGISCVARADASKIAGMNEATSVHLFRIAQEAMQNAAKHSQATSIRIDLRKSRGDWRLTIEDDGIGLPCKTPDTAGMGLRIMQYRTRIMGGSLSITHAKGGGVIVSCRAPASGQTQS